MSASYKKVLKLLEKWPIDQTKPTRYVDHHLFSNYPHKSDWFHFFSYRDLGKYLRDQLKTQLGTESVARVNELYLGSQFEALDRICNNVHCERYKRKLTSTATGVSQEAANLIISDYGLEFVAEENKKGLWARVKGFRIRPQKNDNTT